MTAITIYLGLVTPARVLPAGLSALHVILWKFVLIAFTRVDTDDAKFEPVNVWLQAVRRFRRNLQALGEAERRRHLGAQGLGSDPPSTGALDKALAPLAHWDPEEGVLELHPDMSDLFAMLEDELITYGTYAHR